LQFNRSTEGSPEGTSCLRANTVKVASNLAVPTRLPGGVRGIKKVALDWEEPSPLKETPVLLMIVSLVDCADARWKKEGTEKISLQTKDEKKPA
jgi:hypothetical protein